MTAYSVALLGLVVGGFKEKRMFSRGEKCFPFFLLLLSRMRVLAKSTRSRKVPAALVKKSPLLFSEFWLASKRFDVDLTLKNRERNMISSKNSKKKRGFSKFPGTWYFWEVVGRNEYFFSSVIEKLRRRETTRACMGGWKEVAKETQSRPSASPFGPVFFQWQILASLTKKEYQLFTFAFVSRFLELLHADYIFPGALFLRVASTLGSILPCGCWEQVQTFISFPRASSFN